jgi:hypothetical protein
MPNSTESDLIQQFYGGIIGAMTVGMSIQAQYGDKPLQDLIDAGVTGEDFWNFFKEIAERDIDLIAKLSSEGALKSTAEDWKSRQH